MSSPRDDSAGSSPRTGVHDPDAEYARSIATLRQQRSTPSPDFVDQAVLRAVRARAAAKAQPVPFYRRYAKPLWFTAVAAASALTWVAIDRVPFGTAAPTPVTGIQTVSPDDQSTHPSSAVDARRGMVPVRFVLPASGAREVAVAGEFNGWDASLTPLRDDDGDGVFNTTLSLERGAYAYMFVVDGERWVTDPFADAYRDDGFGNRNAILRIP